MNIVLFDPEELTEAASGASPLAARAPGAPATAVRLPAADRRARHIIDVLRLGPGDSFRAGVAGGTVGTGRLVAVGADGGLRIELESGTVADPGLHPVRLLLGHPRPIVLRRLLRDLSTLGIEQLVVVRTELGEKSYLESKLWQGDDVRRLLIEGAEQAGSTMLPRVEKAWRLADAIGQVVEGREGASRVVFDNEAPERQAGATRGGAAGPRRREPPGAAGAGRIIAVGSERGWTDGERGILRDNGFESGRLGERILRTETAAIAAVAVTLRELGIV